MELGGGRTWMQIWGAIGESGFEYDHNIKYKYMKFSNNKIYFNNSS